MFPASGFNTSYKNKKKPENFFLVNNYICQYEQDFNIDIGHNGYGHIFSGHFKGKVAGSGLS